MKTLSMKILHVKPKQDFVIRDPADGQVLPPYGKSVVSSPFWITLLADGDVVPTSEKEILNAGKPAAAETKAGGK